MIDCRSVHGAHDFCHCAMTAAGTVPAQPLDDHWKRIDLDDLGQFARVAFNLPAAESRLLTGALGSDGTLASGWTGDLQAAVYLRVSGAGAARDHAALVVRTTVPLTVFNFVGGGEAERDVWTARGWTAIADEESEEYVMGSATGLGGGYHYRALIDVPGVTGMSLVADAEFQASVHRAPVRVETEEMQLDGRTPSLHVLLSRSLEDQEFPAGARLRLRLPDGSRLAGNVLEPTRFVHSVRASLRSAVLMDPPAGTYEIELLVIQGVGAHLLFQCTPSADAMATMQQALEPIYSSPHPDHRSRAEPSERSCSLCRVALAAVGLTTLAVAAGAITLATGGGGAALVAAALKTVGVVISAYTLVSLATQGVDDLLEGLCSLTDRCAASHRVQHVVDTARGHLQRYDQMCYLTAHNAYAYRTLVTPLLAQQSMPIRQQLERGVDALMLDLWPYRTAGGAEDIYLCHEECGGGFKYFVGNAEGPRRLVTDLEVVVDVLTAEPERIITLIFEARIWGMENAAGRLADALRVSGAQPFLFFADRLNHGSTGETWDVREKGWPTRKWMIDNHRRLVVFSDQAAEIGCDAYPCGAHRFDDGMPYLWQFVAETQYGDASMEFTRVPDSRTGSPPLTARTRLKNGEERPLLLLMNYFPTVTVGGFVTGRYETLNAYGPLSEKLRQIRRTAGRMPNFLAVDYFEIGADGGPLKVWLEINAAWTETWARASAHGARAGTQQAVTGLSPGAEPADRAGS